MAKPYVEMAAPTQVKALQKPLTVAERPNCLNLPGKQEISRKLHPCIVAHTKADKVSEAYLAMVLLLFIINNITIEKTVVIIKQIEHPSISLFINLDFL